MVKHIIFDCDGVLIDSEIVAAEVLSKWLGVQGYPIDVDDFISHFTGKTFTDIIEILKSEGRLTHELNIKKEVLALDKLIQSHIRPIEGVNEMLEQLELPISAVSNSSKAYVEHALDLLNVSHLFVDKIFSAEMVSAAKPSPLVYELALKTLQLHPNEVIVVEDSKAGAQAAIAAGLTVIGFLGGSHIRKGHKEQLERLGVRMFAKNHKTLTKLL